MAAEKKPKAVALDKPFIAMFIAMVRLAQWLPDPPKPKTKRGKR